MNNKMIKLFLATACLLTANQLISQTFCPMLNGENYWVDGNIFYNNGANAGNATAWTALQTSGAKMIRIGGNNFNYNNNGSNVNPLFIYPNNNQTLQNYVLELKSKGFVPLVQVPVGYPNLPSGPPVWTDNYAASIVNQLNQNGPGYGTSFVQHWIIGNEPDLIGWTIPQTFTKLSTFGYKMRQANLNISYNQNYPYNQVPILIVGPEISYYDEQTNGSVDSYTSATSNYNLIDPTKNTADQTNPVVDIFSFHYYAFGNEAVSNNWILSPNRANVIATLQNSAAFPSPNNNNYKNSLRYQLQAFKTGNPNIKLAITEANICYLNDMNNDGDGGNGANGFIAGQFWAELMAIGAVDKLELLNFWSVKEGQGGAGNIGFLDTRSTRYDWKKSTYQHYNMVAKNFSGKAYLGSITSGPNTTDFKIFASKGCSGTSIMVMNQNNSSGPHYFDINCNNTTLTSATGIYKGKLNLNWNFTLSGNIPVNHSRVYVYDAMGVLVKTIDYDISDHASGANPSPTANSANPNPYGCPKSKKYIDNVTTSYILNRCIPDSATGPNILNNETISSSLTISDTTWIIGRLTVSRGATLVIDSAEVVMSPSASIVIESGGELTINGANIHGCDNQTWGGIDATTTNGTLRIINSTIVDALIPIHATSVSDIEISNNLLMNGTYGIKLDYCKNFTIANNEILTYDIGIYTDNTTRESPCYITENLIYDVNYGFYSESDSHDYLDITCNGFSYNSGGIKCHGSHMKDQGDVNTGPGNSFFTNATSTNHQFYHDGNSITYYCDPSKSFTLSTSGGLAVTATNAKDDATCNGHEYRLAKNNTQLEIPKPFLSCLPNPTSGKLNFNYLVNEPAREAKLVIRNILGIAVRQFDLLPYSTSLETNISELSNGIYFCTLYSGNKIVETKKVIISK